MRGNPVALDLLLEYRIRVGADIGIAECQTLTDLVDGAVAVEASRCENQAPIGLT